MNAQSTFSKNLLLLSALALTLTVQAAPTDLSTVPLSTYFAPSSVDVKPNIMFVLDDSGSMDWDAMPDQATWFESYNAGYRPLNYDRNINGGMPPYMRYNSAFNGIAYNPAVRYQPPIKYNANGTLDTTTYPSMTGVSTATGGDGTATASSPNWKAVKIDGYGVQWSGTSNLTSAAYAYVVTPGEYCDKPDLRTCVAASAPSSAYPYPANMRWCSGATLTSCRATWDDGNKYPRMPAPRISTITLSGSSSTWVSGITITGSNLQIMSTGTGATTSSSALATTIAAAINNCSNTRTGNCTTVGYTATASGSVITIYAPDANTDTPSITKSGGMTATVTSFARSTIPLNPWLASGGTTSSTTIPGENLRLVITPTITSYPYPGSSAKAIGRTDCAGTTCTYAEEMTNYANWYAYYRTRMQMIKSAASRAFAGIDSATDIGNNVSRFRVGYMSINNNTGSDFLNLDEFKTSHKNAWFNKLFAANPSGGTPLRRSLAVAGRLYAGKYNGSSINGVSVTDPLQFSCQQNYTILSTDGFWNGNAGFTLDGSTPVGNQDGSMEAPYNDGGIATTQESTSNLQSRTETQSAEMGTLQSRISQLQTRTSQLQKQTYAPLEAQTSDDQGVNWSTWSPVSSCTWRTSGRTGRWTKCRYNGSTWSAWANENTSCTPVSVGTATSNGSVWNNAVRCQYTAWSAWNGTSSCTNTAQSSGTGTWAVTQARQCQNTANSSYANTGSCTPTSPDSSGNFTECQYSWAPSAATSTCSPSYVANNFTNATVYRNCTISAGAWTNTASCSITNWTGSGTRTSCQYGAWSAWSTVSSCTAADQSTGPVDFDVGTAKRCQTITLSGGNSDTLADVAAYYYNTDLRSPTASDGTGTCTGPIIPPYTTANDLCANNVPPSGRDTKATQHMTTFTLGLGALGKMLFSPTYWTDTFGDFNSVKSGTTADPANGICSWMTSGNRCVWPTPSADDPANIDDMWHAAVNGRGSYYSASDPASLASGLGATLATIVDTPRPGTAAAAASSNPNVSAGDNYVFSSFYKTSEWWGELYRQRFDVDTKTLIPYIDWSARANLDCATTTWQASKAYVAGNIYRYGTTCYYVNTDYVSDTTFSTTDTAKTDVVTHAPLTCNSPWTANTAYPVGSMYTHGGSCYYVIKAYTSAASFSSTDTQNTNSAYVGGVMTSRNIYTKGSSGLVSFLWDNLSTTQKSYFTAPTLTYTSGTPSSGLSQFCTPAGGACLSSAAQSNTTVATGGAAGEALINYLRGDRTNEGTFFRTRKHVLGDIVSSEARYVQTPLFSYTDNGYAEFKALMASRRGAVYTASNDGMLHAFDAESGKELWAYIPDLVLPKLYELADKNYSQEHQFYVDGTPETGDICPSAPTSTCSESQWRTILVGGLNRGGKGYFALDITDPANPIQLWEYTDANMGYSYGNPTITKLRNGQWVVLFASGYNNADGVGRLYVLDAYTGSLIRTISTNVGTPSAPSGLARISALSTTGATNNTSMMVYGGDLLGNLWRFDINGDIGAAGYDAQLLTTFLDASGVRQPITSKPALNMTNGQPLIYVGTGSYLGLTDISNTQSQTMYAVKDTLGSTTLPNPRLATSQFVAQTLTSSTCPIGSSICSSGETVKMISPTLAVDWTTKNGWYVDFLTPGERANTDPALVFGTLAFTTNTPNNASVEPCGQVAPDTSAAWFYVLDYKTGGSVDGTEGVVATSLGNVIATRPVVIRLPDGSLLALIRTSGGNAPGGSGGNPGGTGVQPGYAPISGANGTPIKKVPPSNKTSTPRRVSWREITNE